MAWDDDNNDGPWGRPHKPRRPHDKNQTSFEDFIRQGQENFRRLAPNLGKSSHLLLWAVLICFGIWLSTGFYRVKEGEQAAVLLFGKLNRIAAPGLRYHIPSPIEEARVVKVSEINVVQSGVGGASQKVLQGEDAPNLMLTRDENIIKVRFTVQWFVKDLAQFLFNDPDPRDTVKLAAESAVREVIAQTTLAEALTTGKDKIIQDSKRLLQRMLDEYKIGIQILKVNLIEVNPPDKVRDAFLDVQRARADRERKINEAHAYRNSIIPVARGEAQTIIQGAEADKGAMIAEAQGKSTRFISVLTAYESAPDVTLARLQIENTESVLKNVPKILINGDKGTQSVLPLPLPTPKPLMPTEKENRK
jgi:membrane protease subunit HflK